MHTLRDCINTSKAAKILGVNRYRIYQMISEGKLIAHRLNRKGWLFERADVIAMASEIARGTRRTHVSRTSQPDLSVNGKVMRIDDGISTEEANEILRYKDTAYICRLARSGKIDGQKANDLSWIVSQRSVERFAEERKKSSGPGRPKNNS